jgi:type II secretory pathway component HofQ
MQRERLAKEKAEQERIEFEEREEENRRNIRRKEQEDLRWAKAMEEKGKCQRELDIMNERVERHAKESEERYQKRLEMEEAERKAREQRKKAQPLLNISPFVAITQPVSGGILKTPRTNALTPRSNVSTPRTTGHTPSLSRPNSAVETSSYFKPIRGAAAPPPPVNKEREIGSKEWLQNFELGRQSTPIRQPISVLLKHRSPTLPLAELLTSPWTVGMKPLY